MSETEDREKIFRLDGWVFDFDEMVTRLPPEAYTVLKETAVKGDSSVKCPVCQGHVYVGTVRIQTASLKVMKVEAYGWGENLNCKCSLIIPGIDGVVEEHDLGMIDLFLFMMVFPWRFLFKVTSFYFTCSRKQSDEAEGYLRDVVRFFDEHGGNPERFVTSKVDMQPHDRSVDPTAAILKARVKFVMFLREKGVTDLVFRLLELVREFVAEDCPFQRREELEQEIDLFLQDIPFTFESNPQVTLQDIDDFRQHKPVLAESDISPR